jgi:hypothetical protein
VRTAVRAVAGRFATLAAFEQTLPFVTPAARRVNQAIIDQVTLRRGWVEAYDRCEGVVMAHQ